MTRNGGRGQDGSGGVLRIKGRTRTNMDSHIWLEKTESALEQNDYNLAMRCFLAAQDSPSSDSEYWARLAYCGMELEQFEASRRAAQKAVSLDPQSERAHKALGHCLFEIGLFELAAEAFAQSIKITPSASAYVSLGVAKQRLGRDDEAERSYRCALRIEIDDEEAAFNLAVCIRENLPSEALRLLRHAISIDPEFAAAYRELSFVFGRAASWPDALHCARTAIELNSNDAWAWTYLAVALAATDQPEEAERAYRRAISIDPFEATHCSLLGNFYKTRKRLQDAAMAYRSALNIEPHNFQFESALAEIERELGKSR